MSSTKPGILVAAFLIISAAVFPAIAQTAPEGNAHPESQMVSESDGPLASPFGEADWGSLSAPESERAARLARKIEFSATVDLEPLRGLAVLHDGRVKILDTLARETIAQIVGRKNYQDLVPPAGASDTDPVIGDKHGYDPLFTWLDLMIDPAYYADRPLIAIGFLPLRRNFLEAAFPGDQARQDRWLRVGRVTPIMVQQFGGSIAAERDMQPGYDGALRELQGALNLWEMSLANLNMIAPAASDDPWTHLSRGPESVSRAAADLGAAWRAGDAAGVSRAAALLAAELPAINASVYPESRRSLELAYNRANAFEWGFWVYFLALVTLLIAFGTRRKWVIGLGVGFLFLALGLHAFGFTARCIIAERFAIQNQFESMTGLSLFAAIVGAAIMLGRRQWLFGAAAAGVGFLVLVTATQTAIPGQSIEREAAILNTSVLLKYHVTTVLVSYGLISLGFITSLFYLGTHYSARLRGVPADAGGVAQAALNEDGWPQGLARTLADLDTAQMTVLQLAFWTLGVGILLGAWWADHSWGRWWAFDPKETWALVTWIIYLIVVHLRVAGLRDKGLVTAWMSVIGFFVMLWTYFGVNLLLPGLHAYA
jgi:cytochrome c-type biogenesis protein CcsB